LLPGRKERRDCFPRWQLRKLSGSSYRLSEMRQSRKPGQESGPSLIPKTTGCRELSQTVEDALRFAAIRCAKHSRVVDDSADGAEPGRCEQRPLGFGPQWAHSRQRCSIEAWRATVPRRRGAPMSTPVSRRRRTTARRLRLATVGLGLILKVPIAILRDQIAPYSAPQ
jgi:hypothetical protein